MTAGETTCPACGAPIEVGDAEPLARIDCPKCGEKVRVRSAFDHFELVETVGVGGMGTVYKARDTQLDRFVALKLLRKELNTEEHAARLQHEARVTASVDDPNVVQVFSFGRDHEQFYLVMELVDAGSLDDLIEQTQRVPEQQVLSAGLQVARGLRAAHEKGLIHRDVKPANILFKDADTAKIGDFGLAGVAEENAGSAGEIWGTPYYVAPERLASAPEDFRSDIYSLGATMFHAMAGKPPFEGETNSATALHDLKMHPLDLASVAPDVSRATARVVSRMIEPDPARRFETYDDLITQLEKAAGVSSGRPSRKAQILMGFGALLVIAIAIFFALRTHRRVPTAVPSRPPDPSLVKHYEEARKLLLAEKFNVAHAEFGKVALEARGMQPLYDWARLQQGCAAFLDNEKSKARQAFNEIENAGAQGFGENEKPAPFLDAARKLGAPRVVPAAIDWKSGEVENFAIFLFALKDLAQKDSDDAATLLDRFIATKNTGRASWVEDYKPLARRNLEEIRTLLDWRKRNANIASAAELQRASEEFKAIEGHLKKGGPLEPELEQERKRLADRGNVVEKTVGSARDQQRQQILVREKPASDTAIAAYRAAVARYDFATALQAIRTAQFTEDSLRRAQEDFVKRAQWLIEWKRLLIDDINRAPFSGAIGDPQLAYIGINRASDSELTMRLQYGEAPGRKWTQFQPAALLGVAASYIKPNIANAGDRDGFAPCLRRKLDSANYRKSSRLRRLARSRNTVRRCRFCSRRSNFRAPGPAPPPRPPRSSHN